MYGGAVLQVPTTVPQTPQPQPSAASISLETTGAHPIVWWAHFTTEITSQLVSWGNRYVQVTSSDLELVGSILHLIYMRNCFNICKQTILSHTDNTSGLWWQRKGLAISTPPPSHLIRPQAIHQRFHYYVPYHSFVIGVDNGI